MALSNGHRERLLHAQRPFGNEIYLEKLSVEIEYFLKSLTDDRSNWIFRIVYQLSHVNSD